MIMVHWEPFFRATRKDTDGDGVSDFLGRYIWELNWIFEYRPDDDDHVPHLNSKKKHFNANSTDLRISFLF